MSSLLTFEDRVWIVSLSEMFHSFEMNKGIFKLAVAASDEIKAVKPECCEGYAVHLNMVLNVFLALTLN